MITVLDHQNVKTGGRDILVVNGELSEYRSSEEQREAQCLTRPDGNMKKQKLFSWFFRMKGSAPTFCLYHNKRKGVIMVSNLLSRDEIGRRLPYSFYCDSIDDPVYVRKLFEDYCFLASVNPDKTDCEAIEKMLQFQKNKKKYIAIAVAFFALIVAFIGLITSASNNNNRKTQDNYEQSTTETSSVRHES